MLDRLSVGAMRLFLTAAALAGVCSMGCSVVAGAHDATTEFLVDPRADGTYFGWSEITISQDASTVKGATLQFARLELPDDSPVEDLTFLRNIYGEVVIKEVTPELRQAMAKKDQMPEGESIVPLDLLYEGDLRQFFPDGHTIRMEWTGSTNPAVTIPDGGLWINVRVRVNVE
jgi:hypothetical protein